MGDLYLWIKAVHVIAVISWMAGMLYLPRLFVYHVGVAPGSEASETFKVMERRLLKVIINPAMIVAWACGLTMLYLGTFGAWIWVKFALVTVLSGVHGHFVKLQREFQRDENTRPAKYFRILNEVPTLIMIFVVILVILKPF
ncbi:MAG: protoporphyrinogen oxidase HemJ [Alphaproteobacteria bacterium]|nr:MAG: protoporphyrinogen oxidase HemJ [Alphaproteobacteria bacterium]